MPTTGWKTSIAEAADDGLIVRGYDVFRDLVGKITFADMAFLLFSGELPTLSQRKMMDALFVSVADHGIAPGATVTRFIQSAGTPIQCAVAAGVMMTGDIHGGAGERMAKDLQELVIRADREGRNLDDVATEYVRGLLQAGQPIDGFGHPHHRSGDPRAPLLFDLAVEYGVAGKHIALTHAMDRALEAAKGKRIPPNIDAAGAAIMSDLGFNWQLARAFLVVPRTAGLFAHAYEEKVREAGWRNIPLEDLVYDGPRDRKFTGLKE